MYILTPCCSRTIIYYEVSIRRERAIEICDRVIGRGGKRKIDIREQRLPRFPVELLAQELDHGLKAVRDRHPKEVLFHYRRVSDSFEAHDDFRGVLLLVGL